MTEPLQVGQFAIVDHEPVDRGPNAGVFHGRGPADDRVELFIVAEGTTPAGEAFAGHVVSAMGQALAGLDMSLTGILRRLFAEAERAVADWNRKSIAQHRVALGVSCLVRRGSQVVLGQAGPSAAVAVHGGRAELLRPEPPFDQPIAGGKGPGPLLRRLPFGAGDRVVLLSTPALAEVEDEVLRGIAALPLEEVLPDLYRRVQHLRHQTVLLAALPGTGPKGGRAPAEDSAPAGGAVIDATGGGAGASREERLYQPSLFVEDEHQGVVLEARQELERVTPRRLPVAAPAADAGEQEAALPMAAGERRSALVRVVSESRERAERARAALGTGAAAGGMRPTWGAAAATAGSPPPPPPPAPRRNPRAQSFTRSLAPAEGPKPGPSAEALDLPLVDELAAERRARPNGDAPSAAAVTRETGLAPGSGSLVRVRSSMGGRWRGSGTLDRPRLGSYQLPPTWAVIMAGLAVLVLLVGVLTLPSMLRGDPGAEYSNLVTGAAQKLAIARVVDDPAVRRTALVEAQALLLKARELQAGDPQAETLFNEVAGALNEMDRVMQPSSVEVVASLDRFGERPVAPSRMVAGRDHVYLLDAATPQVIAVALADGSATAVYGEDAAAQRGRPVAIAYLEASDRGSPGLLIVDHQNRLWAWENRELTALAFNTPEGLVVTDIAVRGRDLYVLDAAHKVVYRYAQERDGFPNPPAKALETADLANARRLFVDSEILTADADGTLHRFIGGGVALTLSQAGIDRKLVAAETPQALSAAEVAVLDPANSRVVVFLRDGAFERQYRHPDFAGARAFAVRGSDAYILSGGALRRVTW
ncbi:hypothetical protein [Tepidiforma thermophila]|uniref:PPM-type phosphatase domain-containing protein n=1 Tax=Tepidiforma thermophila (strain KCTC 52669 / CGMCC 1.13589 / G233) TaxID=2761530 RepID=A0A2A9HGY5_TEPT2|nr:hypothetical protein [Tepidiforma thermophila]PFG75284.1 hypothetical protein A9A59_2552 [Tepidiforma thermophila]